MVKHLPYPVASVVTYEGEKYLIDEIGFHGQDYSLLGHKSLNSQGFGIAWVNHDELSLVQEPDTKTWDALYEARTEEDG